jgi:hypothetical protein
MKIDNTKFVGPRLGHAIWLYFGDGISSTQMIISSCSIDGITGNGVRLETEGTGSFFSIQIGNSYIATAGADYEPIYINNGGAFGSIGGVIIDNVQIINSAASTKSIITVTGNGGVNVVLGVLNWGGTGTGLITKGATDNVRGGWYIDANDGIWKTPGPIGTKGSDAAIVIEARNGDPGFTFLSNSNVGGLTIRDNATTLTMSMGIDSVGHLSLPGLTVLTSSVVFNNLTEAQLIVRNTSPTGGGHASITVDKGANEAGGTYCVLSAGTALWDWGAIGNNDWSLRDAINGFVKPFIVEQGSGANALTIKSGGRTLLGTATDDTLSRLQIGGMVRMENVGSTPATPTGGGVLYVQAGSLKFKGSSGTVTTIALA